MLIHLARLSRNYLSYIKFNNGDIREMYNEHREGISIYTNGSFVIITETYKYGVLHGPYKEYDVDGVLLTTYNYAYDIKEGPFMRINPWSKTKTTGQYKNGIQADFITIGEHLIRTQTYSPSSSCSVTTTYYDNGNIREILPYKYGRLHGLQKRYNEQNYIESETTYELEKKHGPSIVYHPNGKIKTKSNYIADKLHGLCFTYDSNGIIQTEESYYDDNYHGLCKTFKDGKLVESQEWVHGSRLGEHCVYYSDGSVKFRKITEEKTEYYRNGNIKVVDTKCYRIKYYENGSIKYRGKVSFGYRDGVWIFYDEHGNEKYRRAYCTDSYAFP